MDFTLYLPDEVGERVRAAKNAGSLGSLSEVFREAMLRELERMDAVERTLEETRVYEIALADQEGRPYTGRITGKLLVRTDDDTEVYLTDDERVLVYDGGKTQRYWVVEDPEEDLRDQLDPASYHSVLADLGLKAVVDI